MHTVDGKKSGCICRFLFLYVCSLADFAYICTSVEDRCHPRPTAPYNEDYNNTYKRNYDSFFQNPAEERNCRRKQLRTDASQQRQTLLAVWRSDPRK